MCGIAGISFEDRNLIRKMTDCIKHRGPDDSGYYTDRYVSLGHRRLSIIDLSKKGRQPMSNEDGSIWIICNGEIYNYRELRTELEKKGHRFYSKSDTEVIIHAYEEYGIGCLNKFNGMFAFAIYDMRNKRVFLARDRIGIKPLYYYFKNNKFLFASEIKSILKCDDVKREVNTDSLNKFMMLRYIPGEETIFRDVKRLKGGHLLVFDLEKKQLSIKKYWDLKERIVKGDESFFAQKLLSLLKKSVERRLVGDVPLGAYLSGGIDSSTVVGILRKINPDGEIKTFSVAFEDAAKYNELSQAKIVSEHFETNHKEFILNSSILKDLPRIIWHADEPLADPAIIPNFFLSREAKKDVTIILTGDGGDELFAGYDQYKFLFMENRLRKLPGIATTMMIPTIIRHSPGFLVNRIYKQGTDTGKNSMTRRFKKSISAGENYAKAYLEIVSIHDEDERRKLLTDITIDGIRDFNLYETYNKNIFSKPSEYLNKFLYFDIKTLLPECYLMKLDKTAMAHSVEGRVPFLDHEIAEFSFTIPPKMKLCNLATKHILKRSIKSMVPWEIYKRSKQTFHVPVNEWIADNFEFFQDIVGKNIIKEQGLFNYTYIEKILQKQKRSKLFYARQLWNLINFQIWHRIFIDEKNIGKITW